MCAPPVGHAESHSCAGTNRPSRSAGTFLINQIPSTTLMNTLQSSFYVVAIVSCLLCAFVGGSHRAPRRFTLLIVYLVLESLRYVFQWLMIQPAAPAKSLWLGSLMI